MAPEVGAAMIAGGAALLAALVGVWQANAGLKKRSAARTSDPELLSRRWTEYPALWNLTRAAGEAKDGGEIRLVAGQLHDWYFPHGVLMSNATQQQWLRVRDLLRDAPAGPFGDRFWEEVERELSLLRSCLKADLNVRTFDEVQSAIKRARAPMDGHVWRPIHDKPDG